MLSTSISTPLATMLDREQQGATAPGVTGYQVGDLVIDLGQQRVTRNRSDIALPSLSFDLLVTLARAAPNLVTFDQLTARVWPHLVITPETISQRVKLVRDALGDDTHAPRYIAGIRGRGYRMVAAVKPLPVESQIQPPGHDETAVTAFNPPANSIAVLPFVNMSGDATQEYFSDGLAEELLNALTRINDLRVAARTSSFSFKGKDTDIGTVARKLNVGAVLEGSVRRSGHTVRITTQLNDAATGFHIWSESYDRDLGDMLQLQTQIATAVAEALKVKLLGDEGTKIELGGTHYPAAFDAYLRGSKSLYSGRGASNYQRAIAAYAEAIRLDPNYALAFAGRSQALSSYASEWATETAIREYFDKAQADAREALKLAPELAEGYLALASYFNRGSLDFTRANHAYERAIGLAPGNAEVLARGGRFAATMGRFGASLTAGRRAVALDPLSARSRYLLGQSLRYARRNEEAVAAFGEVISLEPDYDGAHGLRGLVYYGLGDFQSARSSCELKPDNWASLWCLAVTQDKLGRHTDAEVMLEKLQVAYGDAGPVEYAGIYAQWGNTAKALEWLTAAMRLRNPDLVYVKTEPLLDPLRKEPGFQSIERALKFPE
jgi:TolB-like protein/Flp pilus assembly protein TadD